MIALILMEVTDSTFVAPGAALTAFAGLLAVAAREYRAARREDVEGERKRRIEAETREEESGKTTSQKMTELTSRVKSLEDAINELRESHEKELLEERAKNFRLRKMLTDRGVDIPEELGPT